MAGRGPNPKTTRRRVNAPVRGEWQATPGIGWQHGPTPDAPDALRAATVDVWKTWMRSWWASHWVSEDLPGLAIVIHLYDECQSYFEDPYAEKQNRAGETVFVLKPNPTSELRQMMDNYGITPKGQQDRRWTAPKPDEKPAETTAAADPYGHLRLVTKTA